MKPNQQHAAASSAPRFLFLQYERPLGAAIMATPVFEAIKKSLPQSQIVVACGPMAHQLLAHNPHVDALIQTRDPADNIWRAIWDFFWRVSVRAGRFDFVMTDSSNQRTRIALLAVLARAGHRVGFTLAKRLYDTPIAYDLNRGVLANNLRLPPQLGLPDEPCEPKFYFSKDDAIAATHFLREHGLDGETPIVCFATQYSKGYPQKRGWRAARFAELADRLVRDHACRVVFVGAPSESSAIEDIRGRMRLSNASVAAVHSAPLLAAVLAQCDLLVTLDSGSLHVARAVGLPAVVIARPWQPSYEWLPVGLDNYAILMKPDVVERCRLDPSFDASETIDEISTDEVAAAVVAMLRDRPPSVRARDERLRARLGRQ
jgi:ADP-heptose:LPS heptosyltransferase